MKPGALEWAEWLQRCWRIDKVCQLSCLTLLLGNVQSRYCHFLGTTNWPALISSCHVASKQDWSILFLKKKKHWFFNILLGNFVTCPIHLFFNFCPLSVMIKTSHLSSAEIPICYSVGILSWRLRTIGPKTPHHVNFVKIYSVFFGLWKQYFFCLFQIWAHI